MKRVYALFSKFHYELPIYTFITVIQPVEFEFKFGGVNNVVGSVTFHLAYCVIPINEPIYAHTRIWTVENHEVKECSSFVYEP